MITSRRACPKVHNIKGMNACELTDAVLLVACTWANMRMHVLPPCWLKEFSFVRRLFAHRSLLDICHVELHAYSYDQGVRVGKV